MGSLTFSEERMGVGWEEVEGAGEERELGLVCKIKLKKKKNRRRGKGRGDPHEVCSRQSEGQGSWGSQRPLADSASETHRIGSAH